MWQSTGRDGGKKEWKDKSRARSLQDHETGITEIELDWDRSAV